ncbi:MAG: hypothetical protein J0I43_01790 [Microbacterium sp.]|uniref:hypothetical protein n=1 Tax=Microbacterium sp. TaxID=51671 RepID=UPI001AD2A332|nr:hypothetical protein [Microbacterium sp.]MBN9176090.1 hypothetical protein [Microbacterium sp.]
MNVEQITALLMRMQIIDQRPVDRAVVLEWEADLVGVDDFAAAMEAITMHRSESAARLMPFHIRQGVERIHAAALPREDEWGNRLEPDRVAVAALERLGRVPREVTA